MARPRKLYCIRVVSRKYQDSTAYIADGTLTGFTRDRIKATLYYRVTAKLRADELDKSWVGDLFNIYVEKPTWSTSALAAAGLLPKRVGVRAGSD